MVGTAVGKEEKEKNQTAVGNSIYELYRQRERLLMEASSIHSRAKDF